MSRLIEVSFDYLFHLQKARYMAVDLARKVKELSNDPMLRNRAEKVLLEATKTEIPPENFLDDLASFIKDSKDDR